MASRNPAPQPYRGAKSPQDFVTEIGNVWIGLIERIASDPDQNEALAGYFGVEPGVIEEWIAVRGRTRCEATVGSGRRCANLVGLKVEYDPRIWAAERLRCVSHGPG
ncbi:MAG: hypothetical protein KA085_19875 [Phenylobacterium sp.]|uniref:hypothetical protein n=1 Tax=Phenylobacterium sp. TaxID=1871053 RepID=UPI001B75FC3E|nr:hypothetical protein [Phenylobacterium sp.]MBP7818381.1 hypothetical protein [Phenylobacterium sp.]